MQLGAGVGRPEAPPALTASAGEWPGVLPARWPLTRGGGAAEARARGAQSRRLPRDRRPRDRHAGTGHALTIRNTLGGGRRGGLGTALGVAAGQAVWTAATSAGIAALLVASTSVFATLRLAGAAYLVWLGAQALWVASRGDGETGAAGALGHGPPLAGWAAFRQGVLSNLGNPKMAVFFTSLLPQFTPGGGASFVALLALGLLFCAMTLVWLAVLCRRGRPGGRCSAPARRASPHRGRDRVRSPGPGRASRVRSPVAGRRPWGLGRPWTWDAQGPGLIDRVRWAGYARTRDGAVPSRARPDRRRHLMKGGSCAIASR